MKTLTESLEAWGEAAGRRALAELVKDAKRWKRRALHQQRVLNRMEELLAASKRAENDYLQQLVELKRKVNQHGHAYAIAVRRIEELENARTRQENLQ